MKFLPWTKCLLTSGVLWRHITSTRQLVYHNFLWLSELLFWLEVHVNFPSLKNIFFNYSDSTLVHIMDRVMHLKASDNTVHDFGEMCLPSTQCLFLFIFCFSVLWLQLGNSCTNICCCFLPVWYANTTLNAHVIQWKVWYTWKPQEKCVSQMQSRMNSEAQPCLVFCCLWCPKLPQICIFFQYFSSDFLTHASQKRTCSPWPVLIIISMQQETTIWCT